MFRFAGNTARTLREPTTSQGGCLQQPFRYRCKNILGVPAQDDAIVASFIHIADKKNEQAILRNGIRSTKRRSGNQGVYAMPVTPNFATTHQWARELKRRIIGTLICVQFRIPDDDPVLVGPYNGERLEMTAAEAVRAVLTHIDPMGLEVLVPRKIGRREITRTYLAPRVTGWRYYPKAKGKPPFCHCKWCNRGEIRAKRLIKAD
jgi:hypothetical protein